MHQKVCTRAYRFSGNTPAFPAQWLYGLYVIVLVTGFLATIIIGSFRLRQLDVSTGASDPNDFTVRKCRARQSQPSRPPLPAPRLRRWPTPLWWDRMAGVLGLIWGRRKQEYFRARDWTGGITLIGLRKLAPARLANACDGLRSFGSGSDLGFPKISHRSAGCSVIRTNGRSSRL